MEHGSMWGTPDNTDDYLNDIWTNADLEPPDLVGEIMCSGVNDQSIVGHANSIKEDFVTNGINFCSLVNSKQSARQSASGPSCENVVMKEKSITEESNLCTLIRNQTGSQSAGGPSNEMLVPHEEIQTEASKLCALVNNQISSQNEGGLHRERFDMEEQIGKEVSKLCTLVNNFISSQSEGDLSRDNIFTKEEIVAEFSNMLDNIESSIKCAGGPSRKNLVTKYEIVAKGSNMCTLLSKQSAIGPSRGKLVIKEESATDGSSLFSRGNNQSARKSAGGPRKRHAGGHSQSVVDSAEMQQRRMMKNRASAARSRARSLIRLASLEHEVERYKEENTMLRQKKWRAMENVQVQPRDDKTLRRRNSFSL